MGHVLRLVKRRRWWIIATACCIALGTVGMTLRLTNRYSSEAILSVVQQQVSQRYIEAGATSSPSVVIQTITREILSRGRLLRVADEFGLYSKDRQRLTLEELAQRMQRDVEIEPLDDAGRNDFQAFKITFTAEDPRLAQSVVARLTSLFIEENSKTRGDQAVRTANFLTAELAAAKEKLSEQEKRLQDFKMHNLGELPEQQQGNIVNLTDRRLQLQSVVAALGQTQQQRSSLEAVVKGKVALLESEQSNLLTKYTPRHSEVIKKGLELQRFQALLQRITKGNGGSAGDLGGESFVDSSIAQWSSQANSILSETERFTRERDRLTAEITSYQVRVNFAPIREQQLAEILRDYDLYKKDYTDLLGKQLQSQQAVSLEERQEGQQFRLIDPPTLPAAPSSPKRLKISLSGGLIGLFVAIAVAFLVDMRRASFHCDREIRRRYNNLPLIVAVPALHTPIEIRERAFSRILESVGASVFIVAVLAAEFYIYRHG